MAVNLKRLTDVAMGRRSADLLLTNVRIVNVFSGEIERGDIAIADGLIAGIGTGLSARRSVDVKGRYILPGLINGHVHTESSMLDVPQYARAVVPRGTTALVTDLHEIANVCGMDGINYVLERAAALPFDLFLMAPPCVPATHLETSGATIGVKEIRHLLRLKQCCGLGEMMNYPGVIYGDKTVRAKISAAKGKVIDGHAPGLSGKDLQAYVAAGISSDHESVTLEEAREKLRLGMHIMIREGSSEKNLETLLPLVDDETCRRCMLAVDDRSCADILSGGDIDAVVRKAIRLGLNPVRSIQMATINTAEYFRLERLGAVAPGYWANLIVSSDLAIFAVDAVYYRGQLVGKDRKALFTDKMTGSNGPRNTMHVKTFSIEELRLKPRLNPMPVIGVVPGQIVTRKLSEEMRVRDGEVLPDVERDILKLVVVERHHGTGNIGVGLAKGFGLKHGALASSIAHDSHNIVAVGAADADIYAAIKAVERMSGGLAAVAGGKLVARLPLPVAGLLSDQPLDRVAVDLKKVEKVASNIGVTLPSPFATLSFLALPVIPELRLTDKGQVDVKEFKIIQ